MDRVVVDLLREILERFKGGRPIELVIRFLRSAWGLRGDANGPRCAIALTFEQLANVARLPSAVMLTGP